MRLLFLFLLLSSFVSAQGIKVEYDKKEDLSKYKTFSFGESQVITPKDQKQVSDAIIDKWIKNGVKRELEFRGLKQVESNADLVATYAVGTMDRTDMQQIGPLGQTPGSSATTWTRNYRQTSLIIDLNSPNNLVWRINSTADIGTADGERVIDAILERGFKKFGKPLKKKRSL